MSGPIDPKNVFVVIPVYNEHSIITTVTDEVLKEGFKVVIVDDGSMVGLAGILKNKKVYYLRHNLNLGQGAALQTGIEFALLNGAGYIVTFDADGQHKASEIDSLLNLLITNKVDIVLGSRFIKDSVHHIPYTRKLLLQAARYLNYIFTGLLLTDAHNGLRAMTKEAANKMQIQENRMAHATELLSFIKKNKLKYMEAPATVSYTEYSRKKGQTIWSSFQILFDLFLNKIFK